MNKYIISCIAAIAVLAGTYYAGHSTGYKKRDLMAASELKLALAERDRITQVISEFYANELLKSKESRAIANAAMDSVVNERVQLNKTIAQLRATLPTNPIGNDAKLASCWDVFEESTARYQEVARDADRLVEDIREGQNWFGAFKIAQ